MKRTKRVLVVGGYGETGRRFARYLPQLSDVELRIAGRNLSAAEALVDTLRGEIPEMQATAHAIDVCDAAALREVLRGVDLVMNAGPALPPECIESMAREVIDAGADWLDVQLSPVQGVILRSFQEEIENAKLCFGIQGGFHPGMAALLVRYAATRMDRVESALVSSYLNPEGGIPYTSGVDELVEMFRDYSTKRLENGRWVSSGGNSRGDYRRVEFPFGLGKATCVSMALEELDALPEMVKGLQNTGFFIGGSDFVSNWIVGPLMMVGLKLFPKSSVRSWGRLYCWSMRTFSRPPYGAALLLEASGEKDSRPLDLRLALSHADAYDFTAIPLVATAAQMLEGRNPFVGVHYAAHLTDPERLLADLESLGVQRLEELKEPGTA